MTMPTFVDGVVVHATSLNSLSTGVNAINTLLTGAAAPRAYIPTATARITSNKTISNNLDTLVTFDAAGVNNDAAWTASTNHFTIKTAGVYIAWAQCNFAAASGGIRAAYILLNGTSVSTNAVAGVFDNAQSIGGGNFFALATQPLQLAVNATLYFSVYQNSGSSLALASTTESGNFMSLARIGS
jgi:hypothetical protein